MDSPKSLDSLFKEKIFRIPDYQRGYAWQKEQLKDFWEDLINLPVSRSHYTGVLTLKELPPDQVQEHDKEFWLIDDYSYKVFHIIDGQQRLTTCIIFIQSFIDFIVSLPENKNKALNKIYITDSLNIRAITDKYLYKTKPTGDQFRTYKFGYESDNPSYEYLKYKIMNEEGCGSVQDTIYTLNLNNAKIYFIEQFKGLYTKSGIKAMNEIYRKISKNLLFNEYVIKDEFDVFVAFETMNNRGKKLSDLELLKNRLIYLTTLFSDHDLDSAERKSLRNTVNDSWKEVYYQLGRNAKRTLNDDDFLRAHWTMYFKYSRQTGKDYIKFLLDDQFTPKNINIISELNIPLDIPEEQTSDLDYESTNENGDNTETSTTKASKKIKPTTIKEYVNSLKISSVYWFNSYYPHLSEGFSEDECLWLDRLNRIGMIYFRPLIMSILKNIKEESDRIIIYMELERFIFIVFRMNLARSNYGSSEFLNLARDLDQGKATKDKILKSINSRISYTFNEDDGSFWNNEFYNVLHKKFKDGVGFYGWPGLRYFLFEYEMSLMSESRQKKVDWNDLLKNTSDKISIEHIFPQTLTKDWREAFKSISTDKRSYYNGSLGNLLLLSFSINASLQNENFENKKSPKYGSSGQKLRCGYSDGSHSEIEVSQYKTWGPNEVFERGIKLLEFMESRWRFKFKNEDEKEELLFLKIATLN